MEPNKNVCPKCGFENPSKNHYCSEELNTLMRKFKDDASDESKNRPQIKSTLKNIKTGQGNSYVFTIAISLIILSGLFLLISNLHWFTKANDPTSYELAPGNNDPMLIAKVRDIARNFICTCGSCQEETLAQCVCDHAAKVRKIIGSYIQNHKTKEEIVVMINNDFGGLIDKRSVEGDNFKLQKSTDHATYVDRTQIFSHFRCPCGKCNMDNLAECTCDHPRGAKEVKRFVDDKITEGRYSIIEIVDKVAQTYGSRKF